MSFPDTKYMGSKQAILPFIIKHIRKLDFDTALDAFSGSACVAYAIKQLGKRVIANDFHNFAYHIARATVANNATTIGPSELAHLGRWNKRAKTFVQDNFAGVYYSQLDCRMIDSIYANMNLLKKSPLKRSLALAALIRACMKKRPRGIFTFVGRKSWDGRKDLKLSIREQFNEAVRLFNSAVFSNHRRNRATCLDVFDTPTDGVDLVYIDPPYVSPHSDCDYTRRYHFIEGLCSYWENVEIQEGTLTKKFKSYSTPFWSRRTVTEAFLRLFDHFKKCKIVVSYGSNGIPNRKQMVELLKRFKRRVRVEQTRHKYSFGNQRHKVGNNKNEVFEYLFIAT